MLNPNTEMQLFDFPKRPARYEGVPSFVDSMTEELDRKLKDNDNKVICKWSPGKRIRLVYGAKNGQLIDSFLTDGEFFDWKKRHNIDVDNNANPKTPDTEGLMNHAKKSFENFLNGEEPGKDFETTKDAIDTNDNGKIEKSEMENFTDSLNDYMGKNKKGRDDIPVTTRR